ncbi:MAG: TIGR04283 family arsenosugar biosynthesis glycosyltransferase [Burkholderiaceae bacterium]
MRIAIVVPVLNEASIVAEALQRLMPLRRRGAVVVVVDGGSTDGTLERAQPLADIALRAPRGRGAQMNAGLAAFGVDVDAAVFLHADTRLPDDADQLIADALVDARWGRFDVHIDGRSPWLRMVAAAMNLRSRITSVCTGDQALFARLDLLRDLRGFAEIPLMEDIEFSRRARRIARPAAIRTPVRTSGRRWDRHGVWRTIVLMWELRLRYFLGDDPARLARRYRATRS